MSVAVKPAEKTTVALPDQNAPIFIVGSGRSGSSLLSKMLDMHSRIGIPPESHLFIIFQPVLPYYGDLSVRRNQERLVDDIVSTFAIRQWSPKLDREAILANIEVANFGGIVDATIRSWASQQGKVRWGEKTPSHTYHWREILHYFPNARFIHLMRDGRDVALSYKKADAGPKTFYSAARRWRAELEAVAELQAAVDPSQIIDVRYEDLTADAETTLRAICDFLGETFEPAMLEFYKQETAHHRVNRDLNNINKPLMSNNTQKWRREMTPDDLRIWESIAGPTLERLGYERAVPDATISSSERLTQRLRTYPIKLSHMLRNRNGQAYEWNRVRITVQRRFLDPIFAG